MKIISYSEFYRINKALNERYSKYLKKKNYLNSSEECCKILRSYLLPKIVSLSILLCRPYFLYQIIIKPESRIKTNRDFKIKLHSVLIKKLFHIKPVV